MDSLPPAVTGVTGNAEARATPQQCGASHRVTLGAFDAGAGTSCLPQVVIFTGPNPDKVPRNLYADHIPADLVLS